MKIGALSPTLTVIAAVLLACTAASAYTTRQWANSAGNTNWNSSLSWIGGIPPGSNEVAYIYSAVLTTTNRPYIGGATNVGGLLIYNNGGSAIWNIYGPGPLTIMGSPGTPPSPYGIEFNLGGNTRIYPDIVLGGPQTWTFSSTAGNPWLYLYGTLSGHGQLTKSGGAPPFYYQNTNSPTFSGGLTLNSGQGSLFQWNLYRQTTSHAVGFGTGPITCAGGSGFGLLTTNGAGSVVLALTNDLVIAASGGYIFSSQGGVSPFSRNLFSGTVSLKGPLLLNTAGSGSSSRLTGPFALDRTGAATVGLFLAFNSVNGGDTSPIQFDVAGNLGDGASGGFVKPLILRDRSNAALAILGAANTYTGGTVIEFCGDIDRNNNNGGAIYAGSATRLGTGDVLVMPGGRLRLGSCANVSAGKALRVLSTAAEAGVLSLPTNSVPPSLTGDSDGILAIDNGFTFGTALNMAAVGNGKMFLGVGQTATYSAASLLPCADRVYRLGGGWAANNSRASLTFSNAALSLGDAGGPCSLQVGRVGYSGNSTVILRGNNTLTGDIVVTGQTQLHDIPGGSELQGVARTTAGESPFGASTGNVRLQHGTLRIVGVNTGKAIGKGKLTFGGQCTVAVDATANNYPTQITFDSLARTNNGVLLFSAVRNRAGVTEAFLLSTAPVVSNGICAPYLLSGGADFLTYKDGVGFTNFAAYATSMPTPGEGTNVVGYSGPFNAAADIWALKATGAITGTGTMTIRSGGLILAGGVSNNVNFATAEGVIFANANGVPPRTIDGKVSGSGGITHGGGSLQLSNAGNDFTGLITVSSVTSGYPGPRFLAKFDTLAGNVTRSLGNASNGLFLNGGVIAPAVAGDALLPTRTVTLGPLGGHLYGTFTVYGPIIGSGFLYVMSYANMGTANVTLNSVAPNAYAGGTRVQGTLTVKPNSSLGTGDVLVHYGTLTLQGDSNVYTNSRLQVCLNTTANFWSPAPAIGSLTGAGTVNLGASTTNTTLTAGKDNTSCAFYGKIAQASGRVCGVTKAGNGVWTLYGAHTYTGPTLVQGGTLMLMGSVASNVVVNTGATLGGKGGWIGGSLTLNGKLKIELRSDTDYDHLSVTGNAALNGTLEVALAPGYAPVTGTQWTILGAAGYDATFGKVSSGFVVRRSGNNLVLAHPAPSTLWMVQ